MKLRHLIFKGVQFAKKHYTSVMTGGVVVGVPLTAYLSVKAHEKYKETGKKREYALAVTSGIATIALAVGSETIHVKREALFDITYNALAMNFDSYKEGAKKILGAAGAYKIIEEQAKDADMIDNYAGRDVDEDGETLHWFYDCFSQVWFRDSWRNVLDANFHMQDEYMSNGFAPVQYYYIELELDKLYPEHCTYSKDLGFDCETLQTEYECYCGVPFNYGDMKTPDGEMGIAIEWPINPEIMTWD